jgi:CHAT domain-containing protein
LAARVKTAERLIVVPDGKLNALPFDAIANTAAAGRSVTIAPSASVLYLLRTRQQAHDDSARPLLAIGGVPYDRMFTPTLVTARASRGDEERGLYDATYPTSLPVLATAQQEVLTVARTLGPTSVTLIGEHATESALKQADLSRFGILHFAVHAVADPKFPQRAALVLLNDAAAGEDGLLQPREIARLRLRNAVVVLSACDTSVGPTIGQEGVQNLARAFLLAGAQSIITTLWSVSDGVSTALMGAFYDNLAHGVDVGEALSRAKRAVVERFGPDSGPTVSAFQVVGLGDHRITAAQAAQKVTTQLNH